MISFPARTEPFVKVCCIADEAEAALAIEAGASALGLVSSMPSGPGVISDEAAGRIARSVPPPISAFLLTARTDAASIAEQHRHTRVGTLQLVDHVPHDELARLRDALPGIRLVQVIHVVSQASVDEAFAVAPLVDALLLDSGNPGLAVKELGGTGRVHDWSLSRQIVQASSVAVFLAGGLRPGNVGDAIREVRPHGLDVCSGVRRDGRLHAATLAAFMAAVREAAAGAAAGPDRASTVRHDG